MKAPGDARAALGQVLGGDAVLVSESLAIKHRVGVGDEIELPTATGAVRLAVAGVYYDYSSDRGVVLIDHARFTALFGDLGFSGMSVYLRPGVEPEAARARITAAAGDARLSINTQPWLRAEVLRIFDSTFAITWALELVAIAVAMLGVAGTLLTLMLERQRELTVLRLVGTTKAQVRRMLVGEAVIIGVVGQGIGLVVGLALSCILIYVINVQSFGWTIQFHLPLAFLVQTTVVVIVATAVAGVYPASRAARMEMQAP
jgi:putative ABC transport system permease protein